MVSDHAPATSHPSISRDFWENELELSINGLIPLTESPRAISKWIASRTGRQLNILCRSLEVSGAARMKDQRAALVGCNGQLAAYYLVDHFARRKGKFAIEDFAISVLDPGIINLCRCRDEDALDSKALLYALLHASPDNLKAVFYLDKIHKSGFARMALKQKVRQPETKFEDFLKLERAQEVLEHFDRKKRDHRQSQLKDVRRHHHHHLVFIRRPERHQHIIRDGAIQHGHRPEWIILDFADNARRVSISSDSNEVPLQIANALASAYYGEDVEYDNECQITYEKQILNLLDQLKAGNCSGLELTDLEVKGSPLHGVDLSLCHDAASILRRAIAAIERDNGSLTAHIDRIAKIKVIYLAKRIDIRFEKQGAGGDQYIVRYFDHRLNAALRRQFEDFMRDTHGIPILSTEKRFARHP